MTHRTFSTARLAGVTAAATSIALVWAGTAVAVEPTAGRPEPIPTPAQSADALARMLTYEDAPASLRIAPGWEFTIKADKSLKQDLCTKGSVDISGPLTDLLYQVELGETDSQTDPRSTEQKVWKYRSATRTARDWAVITERARQCQGRVVQRESDGTESIQHLSNGVTEITVNGATGIWIHSNYTKVSGAADAGEGGYYVLFRVGNTIQSVEYDFPDARGPLSQSLRLVVQRLAKKLGDRWLASRG